MVEKLLAELRASLRLRLGLALILGVLWLYGVLLLRDAQEARARAYQQAEVQLARLQQAAQQTEWPQRLEEAKALQAALDSQLWRGESLGLSRAALQDWLTQQMKQAQVARPLITLAAQESDAPASAAGAGAGAGVVPASAAAELVADLWKVKARLNFDFSADSLYALLGGLAKSAARVDIESMRVVREPVARVEMVVVAYFQKPQEAAGSVTGTDTGSATGLATGPATGPVVAPGTPGGGAAAPEPRARP